MVGRLFRRRDDYLLLCGKSLGYQRHRTPAKDKVCPKVCSCRMPLSKPQYRRPHLSRFRRPPPPQPVTTGAEIVIRCLKDQGVDTIFGYPGGAVLPIYDALFKQNSITHVLVRHEQGAAHAAEGYARSTGKVGVVLVTPAPARPTPSPASPTL